VQRQRWTNNEAPEAEEEYAITRKTLCADAFGKEQIDVKVVSLRPP
jgi:hypothetical protein